MPPPPTAVAAPIAVAASAVDAAPAAPPWTWPWYRWHKGEFWTFFWVCLIHVLGVLGLVLFPLPGWGLFAASYGLLLIGGLGTTVGYHRSLAHRSVKLNPLVEGWLILTAMLNGSGSPATWTANHRLHHARSDGPEDISSPRIGGFWWAHLRWLWQVGQSPIAKWAPDLGTRYYRFFTRWQAAIVLVALLMGAPFGWAAFFWMGPIRLMFALHCQAATNSISHMRKVSKAGEDSSQNVAWLAPIQGFQGENWHENHHSNPASARLGLSWKQIDMGWWFIVLMEKLGLASDVRRPRKSDVAVDAAA